MNFNEIYALKLRTQGRLDYVLAQRPAIYAAKKRGEDVRDLWKAYHEARQLLEANLDAISALAFKGCRKRRFEAYILPKGKNRRGDSPWMATFWEMARLAKSLKTAISDTQAQFAAAKPGSNAEAVFGEQLTQLHTERRELKARWVQAESGLLPNQRRKFKMYGPKLAV